MNHILFNDHLPNPDKAPHATVLQHCGRPEAGPAKNHILGVDSSGTGKPQFHVHRIQNQSEYQCDRCGGFVVGMPGRAGTGQSPFVMYCNTCDLTSGGWQTKEDREQFLRSMPLK
jgi:hypothetical protein